MTHQYDASLQSVDGKTRHWDAIDEKSSREGLAVQNAFRSRLVWTGYVALGLKGDGIPRSAEGALLIAGERFIRDRCADCGRAVWIPLLSTRPPQCSDCRSGHGPGGYRDETERGGNYRDDDEDLEAVGYQENAVRAMEDAA